MNEEGLNKTDNNKIYVGAQIKFDDNLFISDLEDMRSICMTNNKDMVIKQLKTLVPTFKHDKAQYNNMKEHNELINIEFVNKRNLLEDNTKLELAKATKKLKK